MNPLKDLVLVLNKFLLAVQVTTVKESINILYKERAKVIDDYWKQYSFPEWVDRSYFIANLEEENSKYIGRIHSPNLFIYSPQIIVLNSEARSMELKALKFSRKTVLERDNFTCQFCNKKCSKINITLDHIIPRSRNGPSNFTNIVTACKACNSWKGELSLEEAGMSLIRQPFVPKWKSFIGKPFSTQKREYWKIFL